VQGASGAAGHEDGWTRLLGSPWLCVALFLVIVTVDAFRASVTVGLLGDALTDEAAHVSTALLALLAAVRPAALERRRTSLVAALVASVAIDLDHVPLYAGVPGIAEAGRPVSHSLATVVLLLGGQS
jgi:inner membrane protein